MSLYPKILRLSFVWRNFGIRQLHKSGGLQPPSRGFAAVRVQDRELTESNMDFYDMRSSGFKRERKKLRLLLRVVYKRSIP
mmetsp:Transcript_26807/g.48317  ORF Transcript_26807/g.48317 Transcript_26807/m.48317 type:complete len:81 (-) Transcript_26807:57-299(-)